MAVSQSRVTVGTSVTLIGSPETDGDRRSSVIIRNRGSVSIFIGGSGVTSTNGFQLDAGESITAEFIASDSIYAVTSTGSAICHILQTGV